MKTNIGTNSYIVVKGHSEVGSGIVEGILPDGRILVRFSALGESQIKQLEEVATCITPKGKNSRLYALEETLIAGGGHGQKRKAEKGS